MPDKVPPRAAAAPTPTAENRALILGAGFLALLISVWLLPVAWRQLMGDLISAPARVTINKHAGQARPEENAEVWREHRVRLETALKLQFANAAAHADLAALLVSAAGVEGLTDDEIVESRIGSILHYQEASRLRPSDPRLWLELARAYLVAGDSGPEFQVAWQRAAILGPFEAVVQSGLFELAMIARSSISSPSMNDWVSKLYAGADERKRSAMRKLAAQYAVQLDENGTLTMPEIDPVESPAE